MLDHFTNLFVEPPPIFRPMPLWVWNGAITRERITTTLEQFAALGLGGVFIHPRPGLISEYLSENWFELWACALHECKRLGLLCNIYDENSFPSGFAGGHVPARAPQTAVQYVAASVYEQWPAHLGGELLALYRLRPDSEPLRLPLSSEPPALADEDRLLVLQLHRAAGNPWTALFPMVDQTHPDVAPVFLATTHERYSEHFGADFGSTIRFVFGDEPAPGPYVEGYRPGPYRTLSRRILGNFQREHGYDLLERIADLFVDSESAFATRYDYYRTLQRAWTRSFLQPLFNWCEQHALQFTAHFYEHEWPFVMFNVDSMDGYRYMHVPAIDLLAPQFDAREPQRSGAFLLTVRELNSVTNQLGKSRALCEAHGVGGYQATLTDFKRLSDWLMVHGVNFIVQHLSFDTISGARKYDYPPTFSDHSPWWPSYRVHADHVARLSVALSQGSQYNRVLVLHPTTTGWLRSTPDMLSDIKIFIDAQYPLPDHPLARLREHQGGLVQWLCDHQIDFDLGDELIMADLGSVDGSRLTIGQRSYDVVVLPEGMENWCASTLALLDAYLLSGGVVLALGDAPAYVDGRLDQRPSQLGHQYGDRWRRPNGLDDLLRLLDELVPPIVVSQEGLRLPALIGHHVRLLEDGSRIHLVTNSGHEPVETVVRLRGSEVHMLDTLTGATTLSYTEQVGDEVLVPLQLPPAGHVLCRIFSQPSIAHPMREVVHEKSRRLENIRWESITPALPNVLMLDFCDLTLNSQTTRGLYVTAANLRCWQAHGFDRDPWDRAIQFGRTYLDQHFDSETGYQVTYHFEIEPAAFEEVHAHGDIELAIERPELYQVAVNGQLVSFADARQWLDGTIRAAPVASALVPGHNVVTLTAQPFNILCEIDRIYLLGRFALDPASTGFTITAMRRLALGDWTQQGLPFYAGTVRYMAEIELPERASALILRISDWAGSVINVRLDDGPDHVMAFPPFELRLDLDGQAIRRQLTVDVVGTLKNLFGPHFSSERIEQRWSGPRAWLEHPPKPAPGHGYEIVSYGLLAPPVVEIVLREAIIRGVSE